MGVGNGVVVGVEGCNGVWMDSGASVSVAGASAATTGVAVEGDPSDTADERCSTSGWGSVGSGVATCGSAAVVTTAVAVR